MQDGTPKELRAAQVAHALARAVREDAVNPTDASRILRHELRQLNTNRSHKLEVRSHGAQASIEKYAPERPPRNSSDDALHADHVYPCTSDLLYEVTTLDAWVGQLRRLAAVVEMIKGERGSDLSRRSKICLLYTSPSPRDRTRSRMPSSA